MNASEVEYIFAKSLFRSFQKAAFRAQQNNQQEICGALLSDRQRNIRLVFIKNATQKAGHYYIHRRDLLSVSRIAKLKGLRLIGTFHSHPVSTAIPGSSDINENRVGLYVLILDVCASECRLWRICRDKNGFKYAKYIKLIMSEDRE